MKIAIPLMLLILIGAIGSGYMAFETSINPNNQLRPVVAKAIDDIKQADSQINALVLESRYGITTDYDELAALVIQLREAMAVLNFGEARAYIRDNAQITRSLADLSEQFSLKIDLIENFKSHNSVLRNSTKYAPSLGEQLILEAQSNEREDAVSLLKQVNSALYRWILYGNSDDEQVIQGNAGQIIDLGAAVNDEIALIEYSTHVITIVEEQKKTQRYTQGALAIDTQRTITQLDNAYLDYYLAGVEKTQARKYFFILYAVFVVLVLVYFSLRFRKNYRRLQGLDDYRNQQVSIAYKHLGYADNHVDNMQGTFVAIKDALSCLGGISIEARKKDYDSRKINSLLSLALKKYSHLENHNAIDKADELLDKSNEDLGKASRVIKSLMASSV